MPPPKWGLNSHEGETECEGILESVLQTRNPYIPFSITCLHKTLTCKRLASRRTHRSIPKRSIQGMKNDDSGTNLSHLITIGRF